MKWFILTLVLEADNYPQAESFTEHLVQVNSGCNEIWRKNIREMTDDEILEFFEKTREQLEGGDIE